jgi:hypothetical protein
MKHQDTLSCRQSGSVIIYALIVLAVGALLLAGWVRVLATRVLATEQLGDNINRRLVLENSRLLARQYLLQNVLPGTYGGATSLALANGWAAFALTGTTTGSPLVVVDPPTHLNVFSPGGADGYGLNISANLSDGDTTIAWDFQTRAGSPIFGHDLFTSQKPTILAGTQIIVSTGLRIAENTVVWVPNSPNAFAQTAGTYQTPTVSLPSMTPLLNGAGQPLLMSNFAFPPVTSGTAGGGLGYDGSIAVIDPTGAGLRYKAAGSSGTPILVYTGTDADVDLAFSSTGTPFLGVSSDGAGTVTIDLSVASSQLIYVTNDVSALILQGDLLATADYFSSATDDKAEGVEVDSRAGLLIVCVQDGATIRNLTSIQLAGQSNRRVYLAVRKANDPPGTVTISTTTAGRWRLAGVMENTPLAWSLAGDLQLIGGLRSDASVGVTGGNVDVYRDADPRLLSRHADRIVWLETYRQ